MIVLLLVWFFGSLNGLQFDTAKAVTNRRSDGLHNESNEVEETKKAIEPPTVCDDGSCRPCNSSDSWFCLIKPPVLTKLGRTPMKRMATRPKGMHKAQWKVRKVIESNDTEETKKAIEPPTVCDDSTCRPCNSSDSWYCRIKPPVVTRLGRVPMTSTATTPDSPNKAKKRKETKKGRPNAYGWNRRLGGPRTTKLSQMFSARVLKLRNEAKKKIGRKTKKRRKEGREAKPTPQGKRDKQSKLQDGLVTRSKNEICQRKQQTTLAPWRQKKSLGLAKSAEKNRLSEPYGNNTEFS